MDIIVTIIPIFAVILLGWVAGLKGYLPDPFLGPANRLVYHVAIPAMIFKAISQAPLSQQMNGLLVALMLLTALAGYFTAAGIGAGVGLRYDRRGTFIQCAGHGNLGYIGLAVAFYYLGDEGLSRAGVGTGFLMILQNLLSMVVLQFYAKTDGEKRYQKRLIIKVVANPVILSAMAGLLFSSLGLSAPIIVLRSLEILSGMALPMALLLIGATLSFDLIRKYLTFVLAVAMIKLALMPAMGFLLFEIFRIPVSVYMPVLILLASPTATVAYVMSKEMGGDPDAAVAAISFVTLMSAVSFTVWLNLAA